ADASGSNEDEVLGPGDEVQLAQAADEPSLDAGLAVEGKSFQTPGLGQLGLLDAPGQGLVLTIVPLRPQQAQEKLPVGKVLLFGQREGLLEARGHGAQVQTAQQLVQLVAHESQSPGKRK